VPPLAPTIKNEQGMIVPSIAGPFLEGTTLRLTCESSTGIHIYNSSCSRNRAQRSVSDLFYDTFKILIFFYIRTKIHQFFLVVFSYL